MAFLDAVKNFAKVTVSIGYNETATTIVLDGGDGARLPSPTTDGAFNLVWWNATDYNDPTEDPNKEIVRCTNRDTDTLTIVRAQESTTATTKNTTGKAYKMILTMTKKMINDIFYLTTKLVINNWTIRTSAVDNDWLSVCWSPELGLFCAVASTGTGNRVMTSPDGITWTIRTSAADNEWYFVCWSPELGLFCAVADSGTGNRVMTSLFLK